VKFTTSNTSALYVVASEILVCHQGMKYVVNRVFCLCYSFKGGYDSRRKKNYQKDKTIWKHSGETIILQTDESTISRVIRRLLLTIEVNKDQIKHKEKTQTGRNPKAHQLFHRFSWFWGYWFQF
jgi:hypothetical protein